MDVRERLDAYAREPQHAFAGRQRETSSPKAFDALRAVLDIHRVSRDGRFCLRCIPAVYPCDTVKAIASELGLGVDEGGPA